MQSPSQAIALIPFQDQDSRQIPFKIQGSISRKNSILQFQFLVSGDSKSIQFLQASESISSSKKTQGERRDGLWKQTCFEAFLSKSGQKPYYEINVSACGDWNIYQFESYRSGMKPADSCEITSVMSKGIHPDESFQSTKQIEFQVDLLSLLGSDWNCPLEVSLTAVIKTTQNEHLYFAAAHLGEKPDFHIRESFIVTL